MCFLDNVAKVNAAAKVFQGRDRTDNSLAANRLAFVQLESIRCLKQVSDPLPRPVRAPAA
jgi:hypothetical protein